MKEKKIFLVKLVSDEKEKHFIKGYSREDVLRKIKDEKLIPLEVSFTIQEISKEEYFRILNIAYMEDYLDDNRMLHYLNGYDYLWENAYTKQQFIVNFGEMFIKYYEYSYLGKEETEVYKDIYEPKVYLPEVYRAFKTTGKIIFRDKPYFSGNSFEMTFIVKEDALEYGQKIKELFEKIKSENINNKPLIKK